MNWICIGMLAGSLITSTHDTREACEGRAVILREAKASAKCVELPKGTSSLISNGSTISPFCSIGPTGTMSCPVN
jgi:hypothetical protein